MQVSEITAEALTSNVCAVATDRYHRIALFRHLFSALVFAIAVLMAGTAALAVIFATDEEWAKTIVAGLVTLAEGAPLKWILDRQGEAKTAEEAAFQDQQKACGEAADDGKIQRDLSFLGS